MTSGHSTKRRKRSGGRSAGEARRSDLGPYVAFAIMWAFASLIIYLTASSIGPTASSLMLAGFFLYVTWCCVAAYGGRKLVGWQKGLVRLPLLLVGSGRTPVREAAGTSAGRNAIVVGGVISLILIGVTIIVGIRTL